MQDLASLKNLGPVTVERLIAVGIRTPDELEQLGPVETYRRVKEHFPRSTSLVLLYALQGALWDAHWNELPPATKAELKAAVQSG